MNAERAQLHDIERLLRIEHACFQTDRFTRGDFTRRILLPAFTILMYGPPLAGYISVEQHRTRARIDSLAVLPEYEKQGIGARLLMIGEEMLAQDGAAQVSLECRYHLIDWYARRGYVMRSHHAKHYEDGAPAAQMTKEL